MSDVTRERGEGEKKLTSARCLIRGDIKLGGCCRNGSHRHHGSATLRCGGNVSHGGTTSRCGRKRFLIGSLTTPWCGTPGVGGGSERRGGFVGLLLADDPPCSRRLGRDSVGLDFLWIHIP